MSESQNSESSDNQWMPLQKEGESDQQVASHTDVSAGKDTGGGESGESGESESSSGDGGAVQGGGYVLPSERNKVIEDLQSSEEGDDQQQSSGGSSSGGSGGEQQSSGDSGSSGSDGSSGGGGYPLPSEQKQQERDAEGGSTLR